MPPPKRATAASRGLDGVVPGEDGLARCPWCGDDPLYTAYHDHEWGRPVHDEVTLFEKLCLEGFQSGLSWLTILRKREAFRAAFAGFEPHRVAAFDADDVTTLLADPGIVRHRGKIEAVVTNARALLTLHAAGRSLTDLVWSHAPVPRPRRRLLSEVPAHTVESTALARDLHRAGFTFVGPTTSYALMQAMGVVDDHLVGCHLAT